MPKGRPPKVKTEKSSEEKVLQLIAENPGIIEAIAKLANAVSKPQEPQIDNIGTKPKQFNTAPTKTGRIYKSPVQQVAFDDPSIGKDSWDKKRFPSKKKFKATEPRPPVQKFTVNCGTCGRSYETTQKVYGDEFGYTCTNCIKQRQT